MVQIAGGDKAGQQVLLARLHQQVASAGSCISLTRAGWLSIPIMIRASSSARPISWPVST
jgi:hypothetical protein